MHLTEEAKLWHHLTEDPWQSCTKHAAQKKPALATSSDTGNKLIHLALTKHTWRKTLVTTHENTFANTVRRIPSTQTISYYLITTHWKHFCQHRQTQTLHASYLTSSLLTENVSVGDIIRHAQYPGEKSLCQHIRCQWKNANIMNTRSEVVAWTFIFKLHDFQALRLSE